jgi:hypothetical protein
VPVNRVFAAGRRRELLPLGVVEVRPATALEELDHRGRDAGEDRDLHELAEEPALLLRDLNLVRHLWGPLPV